MQKKITSVCIFNLANSFTLPTVFFSPFLLHAAFPGRQSNQSQVLSSIFFLFLWPRIRIIRLRRRKIETRWNNQVWDMKQRWTEKKGKEKKVKGSWQVWRKVEKINKRTRLNNLALGLEITNGERGKKEKRRKLKGICQVRNKVEKNKQEVKRIIKGLTKGMTEKSVKSRE